VQSPFNSQSYNRYTYVWNNPMSLVDPSGWVVQETFGGFSDLAAILGLKEHQTVPYATLTPYNNYWANEGHSILAAGENTLRFGFNLLSYGVGEMFNDLGGVIDSGLGAISYVTGIEKRELYRTMEAMAPGVGSRIGRIGARANLAKSQVVIPNKRNFLSVEDFANLPKTGTIDPKSIRFSQDSINYKFSEPFENQTVDDFVKALKNGDVDPSTITPIRIVEREGKIFTLDNRRLHTYQEAGIDIPFQKLDGIPKRQQFKFSTENDGVEILIRRGKNK